MIDDPDWNAIRNMAEKVAAEVAGRRSEFFTTGTVVKRDEKNKLVWLKGFADDPIPIVDFEHEVRYYDTDENGRSIVRKAKVTPVVPRLGQTVVVLHEMGISTLPRCVGVLLGTNWVTSED